MVEPDHQSPPFLISIDPRSPDQPSDKQDMNALVLELRESALKEEQSGCFGKAEVLWKKATGLAERYLPNSQLFARVAIDTGKFLSRFLPKSQIPLKYLRAGLSLRHLLDIDEVTSVTLAIAECLIRWSSFKEAEEVLGQLDRSNPEIDVQVMCCLGINEYVKQDILKAEAILRKAVEKSRSLQPELYAKCMVHFCKVLLEKEQYLECQSLLPDVIEFLVSRQSPLLLFALWVLTRAFRETYQFDNLDSTFESVIKELQAANAPPYYIAAILTEWGDCYSQVSAGCAAVRYIQSLRLYQSIQRSSWYVVRVILKLLILPEEFEPASNSCYFGPSLFAYRRYGGRSPLYKEAWYGEVKSKSEEILNQIISELPIAVTALSVSSSAAGNILFYFIEYNMHWLKTKLEPLFTSSDDIESGEALLCLADFTEFRDQQLIATYISSHPNCLLSGRLFTIGPHTSEAPEVLRKSGASELEIESYLKEFFFSMLDLPGRKINADLMKNPVSFQTVDALMSLFRVCRYARNIDEEALEMQKQALRMAAAINPFSSRYFDALFACPLAEHPEETFLQVLQTVNPRSPISLNFIDKVYRLLHRLAFVEVDSLPAARLMEVVRKLEAMACRTPIHFAFLDTVKLFQQVPNQLTTLMKRVLLYCADNKKAIAAHHLQLKAELDWLYGAQRQLVYPSSSPWFAIVMMFADSEEFRFRVDFLEILITRGNAITGKLKCTNDDESLRYTNFIRDCYEPDRFDIDR